MAHGHADRVLETIRRLEAETRELLSGLDSLDPEQAQWLHETGPGSESALSRGRLRLGLKAGPPCGERTAIAPGGAAVPPA
jgi:hypothetical protein